MSELTREQVLGMGAGPEMDMLVAVKVFRKKPAFNSLPEYPRVKSESETYSIPVEEYSTSISAAWEVLENLKEEGFRANVNIADEKHGGVIRGIAKVGDWHSNILKGEERRKGAYAETAPLAICRAALLTTIQGE